MKFGKPDGDGRSNADEFEALTDPTDPASVFHIDVILAGDHPTLWFHSVSGRLYAVQGADLLTADWLEIQSGLPGTNGPTAILDTNRPGFHFYRLRVTRP